MPANIKNIQDRFIRIFTLSIILETFLRLIICVSFTNRIYAISLAGVLLVFTLLYILYLKKELKEPYAVGIILSFYFITHFVYIIGTYRFIPIMLLWLLVVPIATRIYFSNRTSILICIATVILFILVIYTSVFTDMLNHYEEILPGYYGEDTSTFVINTFVLIIFFYIILATFHMLQVLLIQYPKLDVFYRRVRGQNPDSKKGLSGAMDIKENKGMREARLQGVYKLVMYHIETSKCYLNPNYTLEQLALELKIHKNTISSSLSHAGKVTFKNLLNKYRINAAKECFAHDEFRENNIKQVYMRVGFKYNSTFNRSFKGQEGITPSEYIAGLTTDMKNEI